MELFLSLRESSRCCSSTMSLDRSSGVLGEQTQGSAGLRLQETGLRAERQPQPGEPLADSRAGRGRPARPRAVGVGLKAQPAAGQVTLGRHLCQPSPVKTELACHTAATQRLRMRRGSACRQPQRGYPGHAGSLSSSRAPRVWTAAVEQQVRGHSASAMKTIPGEWSAGARSDPAAHFPFHRQGPEATGHPEPTLPAQRWAQDSTHKTPLTFRCQKAHERRSASPFLREMQIKTIIRHHFTSVRTATIKKSTNNKCWRGCAEKGTLHTAGGNAKKLK